MHKVVILFALSLVFAVSGRAQTLVSYWDLNGNENTYPGMSPNGSLTVYFVEAGIAYLDYDNDGTTVNLPTSLTPAPTAGQAAVFAATAEFLGDGYLEITGLNFSGLSDVSLSFAGKKNVAFEVPLFTYFNVEYRLNGGSWTEAASLAELPTSYESIPVSFGSVLNNATNAGIRIHFQDFLEVSGKAHFDNIQITAVPEPLTMGLMALAILGGILFRRGARSRIAPVC